MRNKKVLLVIVVIFTILFCVFSIKNDKIPKLFFSNESGFYDEPFYLNIESNIDGIIYYTTDGSDPTDESNVYNEPIYIYDASINENVYSARNDTSSAFFVDFIKEYSHNNPEYEVPNYLVDKCFVIKAFVKDKKGQQSNIETKVYFIDFNSKSGYKDLNVISIVTDPDNLFDYYDGIYTTGKVFEKSMGEVIESGQDRHDVYWEHMKANYSKEYAGEKQANCQFFVNNKLVLNQDCVIKIHGGGSRSFNQKSFNLYARDEFNEDGMFNYNFFGNDYYPSSMTLFNGGDDNDIKLKDYIVNTLYEDNNFSTMKHVPYVLFLDGEYWGFYWLTEKYDENYVEHYYDVSENNTIIMKNNLVEVGNESDIHIYNDFYYFCTERDMNNEENYNKLLKMIDIDSCIDYYASLAYVCRCGDWPSGNVALWRARKTSDKKYEDGKWRWMLFDVNSYAMSYEYIDYDNYADLLEDPLFSSLINNEKIKEMFFDKLAELENNQFSVQNVNKLLSTTGNQILEASNNSNRRFWGDKSINYYSDGLKMINEFFLKRPEYINRIIKENK